MLTRRKCLTVSLFCFAASIVMLYCTGCGGNSPTAPFEKMDCAAQSGCSNGPATPLPRSEEKRMLDEARTEVEQQLGRAITTPDPRVVYVACPFQVGNSNFGNVCAAGATYWQQGYIQVMTFDAARTAPLVKWEGKNWFLCHNGRCDLAV
jgi:hypothetical protein